MAKMKRVRSDALHSIGYNRHDETMVARYSTGGTYFYENVPPLVFREIRDADKHKHASVGKTFLSLVKNHPERPGHRA